MRDQSPVHILIGGSDQTNGDYSRLRKWAGSEWTARWSSLKTCKRGDRVLIYVGSPHFALIASAKVVGAVRKGSPGDYPYRAAIGDVRWLRRPISLAWLRRSFPDWGWPTFPRSKTTVPTKIAGRIWRAAENAIEGREKDAKAGGKAEDENRREGNVLRRGVGGGFGDAEANGVVERAAIKAATRVLRDEGYLVVSREAEKIGYDLEAKKGRRIRHVEVKGISGALVRFPITAGEVQTARSDAAFELWAVTEACSASRKVHRITRTKLLSDFRFVPTGFFAVSK